MAVSIAGGCHVVIAALLLWSIAGSWFFPAFWPDGLSLMPGCAPIFLHLRPRSGWPAWFAQSPCRSPCSGSNGARYASNALLYLPLIVPSAAGDRTVRRAADVNLDGTATGVVWSHLLWVLPYMVLTLVGPIAASMHGY